jgi:hypothetical protein
MIKDLRFWFKTIINKRIYRQFLHLSDIRIQLLGMEIEPEEFTWDGDRKLGVFVVGVDKSQLRGMVE